MHKFKISIRVKMALLVCAASAILFAVAIGSVYMTAVRSLEQAAGEDYAKMARLMANAVAEQFDAAANLDTGQGIAGQEPAAGAAKGKTEVSDISYNDSQKEWLVTLSVPKGGKVVLPVSVFSAPLENFKLGKTGEAVLVDDKGYIVYQRDSKPFLNKFCSYDELQAVLQAPEGWRELNGIYRHDNRVLVAFAEVTSAALSDKHIRWWAFVAQDVKEAYAPSRKLVSTMSVAAVFLTLVSGLLALLLGSAFTGPIKRLREGIANIGRGDLDKKIEIESGDEIETLAESFNEMAEGLKKTTTSVANLSRERTEHEKAEGRVRHLAGEWNSTFDSVPDMAFITDQSMTITKANRALLEAVRLGPGSVIGKKCYEVLHKTGMPWPACPFDPNKLGKGTMVEEIYEPHLDKHLLVTVAPIFDPQTGFSGTIHVARDISEIKTTREELGRKTDQTRALKQFKNDLISMVSRLRSSIHSVGAEIKTALESLPAQFNEKQRKAIGQASLDIDQLGRSIDTITDVATLEAGKMELRTQVIDIKEPVKKAIFTYEPRIRDRGLDLKISMPKERLVINADPARIERVFGILISNALKFTQKGRIDISVRELQNNLECCIADTGIGIPKGSVGNIFDRFSQGGGIPERQENGMGVGLYIAKGIIELHGGRIWVESEPGKGTAFTFILPKYAGGS